MSIINQRVTLTITGRDWVRLGYLDTKAAMFDIEIDLEKLAKGLAWRAIRNASKKAKLAHGAVVISYEGYKV